MFLASYKIILRQRFWKTRVQGLPRPSSIKFQNVQNPVWFSRDFPGPEKMAKNFSDFQGPVATLSLLWVRAICRYILCCCFYLQSPLWVEKLSHCTCIQFCHNHFIIGNCCSYIVPWCKIFLLSENVFSNKIQNLGLDAPPFWGREF